MALHAVRKPFATVVLVVRDAERRIVRSLESALNQSSGSVQVVVSDCGSRDRTVAMCRSIAERDIRVDVIENGEVDYAQAFDAALEQARGDYILAMAQDDWLAPGALAALERAVKAHDLELAIMALSVDEPMGSGGHASHVLRFSVEPTTDAEAFRDEVPLFMNEGILGFVRGKLFERARIEGLGMRMGLLGSQTAFMAAYIEDVERVARSRAPYTIWTPALRASMPRCTGCMSATMNACCSSPPHGTGSMTRRSCAPSISCICGRSS
ncbi:MULTISPECIES: glycosyltransferase family 2 protein [Enorma]|uniref:glycosyltransferase family 2 protein n=1 Tax=Enorma TaxID=1472762 RepID=UPI000347D7F2|nr:MULTISPECIES: glycosyltransferase [Enorma]